MKKNDTIGIGHFLHQENPKGLFQLLISSISSNRYLQNPQAGQTVGKFRKDVSPPDALQVMLLMALTAHWCSLSWCPLTGYLGNGSARSLGLSDFNS